MIKAASVYTYEIDDVSLACREITTRLHEKLTLLRHSVGILQCDPEFIEAGLMGPLYETLGFPLVGGTTTASATNDAQGSLMLSILVLTSDDVEFVASHTQGFEEDCFGATRRSFQEALGKRQANSGERPRLALVFPPIIDAIAGDSYIEAVEDVCGNVPVFGPLSVDDTLSGFDRSASVLNGMALKREMTYVLMFGNVNPRFSVATVSRKSNLAESRALITRVEGNVVYEINQVRAIDYFESVGLAADGRLKDGIIFVPLLITLPEGGDLPFVRALISINPDGSAVFRGKMMEGAEFSFGSNLGSDVLASTSDTVAGISEEKDVGAALLFSCIVRQLVIGGDSMRELALVKDAMPTDVPFIVSYAGGEISPTGVCPEGTVHNRFHNYSFISCLL